MRANLVSQLLVTVTSSHICPCKSRMGGIPRTRRWLRFSRPCVVDSWIRGTVTGVQDDGRTVAVRTEADWSADVPATDCHVQNERDDTLDDLVKSDYLHEAGCAAQHSVQHCHRSVHAYRSDHRGDDCPWQHQRCRHGHDGHVPAFMLYKSGERRACCSIPLRCSELSPA